MSSKTGSSNFLFSAIIAFAVYVPFTTVAKATVLVSGILFIVDPIPPYTRLVGIVSCGLILKLNAWYREHQQHPTLELVTAAAASSDDQNNTPQQHPHHVDDDDETKKKNKNKNKKEE